MSYTIEQIQTALQDDTVSACMSFVQKLQNEKAMLGFREIDFTKKKDDIQNSLDSITARLDAIEIEIAACNAQLATDMENAM